MAIRALKLVLPPTLLARGPVPGRSIRALWLVLPPTFLARGRAGFIVPLFPRHGTQGAAYAGFEWRLIYFSTLLIVSKKSAQQV